MDWKIIVSTFITVFLGELGDKTQLASILMTSKTNKPVLVLSVLCLPLRWSPLLVLL